jgi:hypothetical protein
MKLTKNRLVSGFFGLSLASLTLGIVFTPALAVDYPSKPVTLLVGYPPGGGGDLATRSISVYFTKKWGQQIVVVNKPGGNLVPVNLEMYNSKPDGYTLLSDTCGASSIQVAIMKNLPFKLEDRTFLVNAFYSSDGDQSVARQKLIMRIKKAEGILAEGKVDGFDVEKRVMNSRKKHLATEDIDQADIVNLQVYIQHLTLKFKESKKGEIKLIKGK